MRRTEVFQEVPAVPCSFWISFEFRILFFPQFYLYCTHAKERKKESSIRFQKWRFPNIYFDFECLEYPTNPPFGKLRWTCATSCTCLHSCLSRQHFFELFTNELCWTVVPTVLSLVYRTVKIRLWVRLTSLQWKWDFFVVVVLMKKSVHAIKK